jgi:hypothetical protein
VYGGSKGGSKVSSHNLARAVDAVSFREKDIAEWQIYYAEVAVSVYEAAFISIIAKKKPILRFDLRR